MSKYDNNMLSAKPIVSNFSDIEAVKNLYHTAFPRNERAPFWMILRKSKKDFIDFLAFYDEDLFVGFAYTIQNKDLVYIMYLAVNTQIHSKGYGTRILEYLDAAHPQSRIVLEIEILDDSASNSEQRKRRKAFYLKNGYASSGLELIDAGVRYEILTKNGQCTASELSELFKRGSGSFLFRFVKPDIFSTSSSG